jgi:hypothetical protein
MPESAHKFPRPWIVTRSAGGYSILDANNRAVAFVYFVEGFRDAFSGQSLSADEGRHVAEALSAVMDSPLAGAVSLNS